MRSNLQSEAKALASPTRNRMFRYIVEAAEPVTVAELTSYLGFNHNAIRQHLAVLVEAGLVVEALEPSRGRGRPRLLYRLSPYAAGLWETSGPYEYLAGVLASALQEGISPREAGRAAGQVAAAGLEQTVDPLDAIEEDLHQRGFRPERVTKGAKVDFVLGRCPFEDVAATSPTAVCEVHLGLAEGLAERVGGCTVTKLVAKNPHRAGCRLALHRQ